MNKPRYLSITYDMSKLSDDEQKAVIAEASSLFRSQKAVCAGWEKDGVTNNGWISTDDELLKQYANKEILIYVCDTVKKTIYSVDGSHYIDDDGKEYQYVHWFSDEFGNFMWEFDEVKYWQPLPQPPKERMNDNH